MNERQKTSSAADPGLRKMLMWVAITLVLTVALAAVVVELTLRWFAQQ
jgi:flagellar basal body-associated protein FliL